MQNRSIFKIVLVGMSFKKENFIKDLYQEKKAFLIKGHSAFGTGFSVIKFKDQEFQIWDTLSVNNGMFKNLNKLYFNKADGAIFFDVSYQNEKEFKNQLNKDTTIIRFDSQTMTPEDCLLMLHQELMKPTKKTTIPLEVNDHMKANESKNFYKGL